MTICARGGVLESSALVVAAWCYYSATHTSQTGESLEIIDALSAQLQRAAKQTPDRALAFLQQADIFGDLAQQVAFSRLYEQFVSDIFDGESVMTLMNRIVNTDSAETFREMKESTA